MKLIKRKIKKIMKSKINRRLFRSFGKLGVFSLGFFLMIGLNQAQRTNSFFFDGSLIENNNFSAGYWVAPEVEVTNPEEGDEWQIGSTHDIEWTATSYDPSATAGMLIDINYRCNSGSWNNIETGTENDGSYTVTVPAGALGSCEFRVFATDLHGLTGMDDSDEFDVSYMVVLNEFVPNPASGLDEMVEIYNYGSEPVDVDDWFITDDNGPAMHRRVIDSAHTDAGDTVIDPGTNRFLVIENYSNFYLNDTGSDEVRLYDDASNLIDIEGFSNPPEGKSYARIPDGVGNWVDPVPTPGEKNNPSNDPEDMKDFYEKACFDEDDEPICKESFLKSLGLLDEEDEDEDEDEKERDVQEKEQKENPDQVENSDLEGKNNNSDENSSDEQGDSNKESSSAEATADKEENEDKSNEEEVDDEDLLAGGEEADLEEEFNDVDDSESNQVDENSEEDEVKEEDEESASAKATADEEDEVDEKDKESDEAKKDEEEDKEDEDETKEEESDEDDEELEEDHDEDKEKDQDAKKEDDEEEEENDK